MELNTITGNIVAAALRIHQRLGPGLYEHVYEAILAHELKKDGHQVERQKGFAVQWDGLLFKEAFRADLVVDGKVIVEVKSKAKLPLEHEKQVLTYLKILDLRFGLLLNFGAPLMKDGIKRYVNGR
jgi:GxxExxY protein